MNIAHETTKARGATILILRSKIDNLNPALALAVAWYDAASAALRRSPAIDPDARRRGRWHG
ncbi:hypothetical protein ABIC50_001184 [Burkholderia sp. 567]|jgi:hypothetical protein